MIRPWRRTPDEWMAVADARHADEVERLQRRVRNLGRDLDHWKATARGLMARKVNEEAS